MNYLIFEYCRGQIFFRNKVLIQTNFQLLRIMIDLMA